MLVKNLNSVVAFLQLLSVSGTLAHPGGMPRLMGRGGFVEVQDLPDRLAKRVVTPDGSCGGTNGYTCGTTTQKCCSQYGWCGDTTAYCLPANNCQPAFGICTGTGTTTTTATTMTTTTTAPTSTATNISTDGTCGTNGGHVCPTGQCCSPSGFCGTTEDYCMAPGCQTAFGDRCDANQTPSGANTSTIARPLVGSVPWGGAGIYDCNVPGEIALTFDDGPYIYTSGMLDVLSSYNALATFFITGNNNGKGPIDTTPAWNAVILKMYAAGHQLASHTWSHPDLSTLTEAGRRGEMIKLEMAMRNIVGFFPTYMRPPYSSCTAACQATMTALGYHVIYFDVDTDDYDNDSPLLIQNAKNNFLTKVAPSNPATGNFLVIAHDIHQQTAQNLTAYMLDTLLAKGYTPVTVGKCLGDPQANWYRSAGGAVSVTSTTTATPTTVASSTASATTTAASGTCPFQVSTWCATPLPTYSTTSTCWDSVTNCYAQGSACWNAVAWPASSPCGDYQTMCHTQEAVCQACADAGTTSCNYVAPVYPAS